MNLCSQYHAEICYEDRDCPLCGVLEEKADLKDTIVSLQDEISALQDEISALHDELLEK